MTDLCIDPTMCEFIKLHVIILTESCALNRFNTTHIQSNHGKLISKYV